MNKIPSVFGDFSEARLILPRHFKSSFFVSKALIVSTLVLSSVLNCCTTPTNGTPGTTEKVAGTDSHWDALKDAQKPECVDWPMAEKDLEVLDVLLSSGPASGRLGVVGQVKQRNASVQTVFMPLQKNGQLDVEQAIVLPFAQSSVPLSVLRTNAEPALLVGHVKSGRSTFDLRDARDNKVLTKASFYLDGEVTGAELSYWGRTYWVTLHFGDYDTQYIRLSSDKGWKIEKGLFTSSSRRARVINHKADFMLVDATATGSQLQITAKPIKGLGLSGVIELPESLALSGALESVSIAGSATGIAMIAVAGDSMVGQGVLHIADFKLSEGTLAAGANKTVRMQDLHLGEPVSVSGTNPIAAITKWLDSEASIAVVQLGAASAIAKDIGPFQKGSVIVDLVAVDPPKSDQLTALIRSKQKDSWQFKVCLLNPKY